MRTPRFVDIGIPCFARQPGVFFAKVVIPTEVDNKGDHHGRLSEADQRLDIGDETEEDNPCDDNFDIQGDGPTCTTDMKIFKHKEHLPQIPEAHSPGMKPKRLVIDKNIVPSHLYSTCTCNLEESFFTLLSSIHQLRHTFE